MVCLGSDTYNRCDPLGARLIISAIKASGPHHKVLHFLQDRIEDRGFILDLVTKERLNAVWVSIQPCAKGVVSFLSQLSEAANAPLILGNIGARYFDESDLRTIGGMLTIIVKGPGEAAATKIAKLISNFGYALNDEDLHGIDGLCWVRPKSAVRGMQMTKVAINNNVNTLIPCKALRSDIDALQSYFLSAQNGFCAPWRSRTDLPLEGTRAFLKLTRSFGAKVIVVSLRNAVDDLRPPIHNGGTPPFIKLSSDFVLVPSPQITETGHYLRKLGLIEGQDCLLMYNGDKAINFSSDRQGRPGIDIEPSKANAIAVFIERYPQYQAVIGLDNDPKQLQKMEHLVSSTILVLGDLPAGVNPKNVKRFPRMNAWDAGAVDRLAESVNRPFGHKL